MNWDRSRAAVRGSYQWVRQRVTWRRTVIAGSVVFLIAFLAITTEAVIRARLDGPAARMPSALYTRAVPWGGSARSAPVAIGTLDGAPMEERVIVPLNEVPPRLIQAILAVEDQRFYQHHGLDVRRIGGALVANVRAHGIVQGGSTLTQQLAKNLFLSANRTPLRKIREAAMALVLEARYSKSQILEAYLNEIYLGQDGARGIHGVGAASRYYLGRDVRRISLAEAAQLAAMISAPNRTEPSRHPDAARERRDMVLQLMVDQHRIPDASASQARDAEVTAGEHAIPVVDGRYFRDFVLAHGAPHTAARGAAVYTTLDASLQRAAERAVANGLARLSDPAVQAAMVVLDPHTGEVLAMVGGRDYGASQFNRAVEAHRQPGSAFKPIVAMAALGRRDGKAPAFTLASELEDEPLSVQVGKTMWEPVDYDQGYRGRVTLREAMEESLNIPFARVGLAIGPARIVEVARQVGIISPLEKVPSIALGSSEVTPLELARAYGVLASSGSLARLRVVTGVSAYGKPLVRDSIAVATPVLDSAVSYLVTSALQGVVTRGTARALNQDERFEGLAGKTGTSSNWRDAWFLAYSPSIVVAVWVGFDDGRSVRLTGAAAALPIAASFLRDVTPPDGWHDFDVPSGVTEANVGSDGDGMMSECGSREYFLTGTEPAEADCDDSTPMVIHGRDWGSSLGKRAERLIERLIAHNIQIHWSGGRSLQ